MGKKNKKEAPAAIDSQDKVQRGIPANGVWGLFILIIIASVLYANFRVFMGVDELIPRLMLVPSTLGAVMFLLYKAIK